MEIDAAGIQSIPADQAPPTPLSMFVWRFRRNTKAVVGLVIVLSLILIAIFAPILAPQDPLDGNLSASLVGPGGEYLLGTDKNGRDVLSRLIYGARVAIGGALGVVIISELIGVPLGIWAGYKGGRVDAVIMRFFDLMLAFPPLLLSFAVVAAFGPSLRNVIISLGILYVPFAARVVRSVTLVQKEMVYTEAARAMGYPQRRIVFRHILPNTLSSVIVVTSLDLAFAMLDIAALSFLGLGVQPPTPDWGTMLSEGRAVLLTSPHVAVGAGVAILIAVLGFNLLGDGLRDVLDPRQANK
ncbi:MAG: ABC transporter permease [Thermomicrobiales bacterium]|nr:ABC transporter permease [Thermomicrobiales bacterium]